MESDIFVCYNPNAQPEESTALRLQTISNLYGLKVSLPSRQTSANGISQETKLRIDNSRFVVAFCLESLSYLLTEELNYAILKQKPIVVIYDVDAGKKINFKEVGDVKEVFVDFSQTDDVIHEIADFLRAKLKLSQTQSELQQTRNNNTGLSIAVLGIGIGLLAAWALSQEK
jgi:hypothetical protein